MSDLNTQSLSLLDFCKAIEFIAPQGKSIEYFIEPKEEEEKGINAILSNDDFEIIQDIVPTSTSTTIYMKKDLADIQNDCSSVFSPASMIAEPLENSKKLVQTTDDPLMTFGGKIPARKKAVQKISENLLVLKEDIGQFKKGILIYLK